MNIIMTNQLNLNEIDQEQALNLSKFFIQSNQNLFIFGRRGVGKTHIIMQAAKECNYNVNYINLSVIERPDLAGYPDMSSTGDIIKFKSPIFLPHLIDDKPNSIILFDEVDKAPPEITSPLLEILQFKSINGKKLNAASCILTGNLSIEGAYSNHISSALLDRGAKYILSFSFEKWLNWAKTNNVHDLILGFLTNNQEFACGKLDDLCYASPSPRGWTLASESLFKANELKIVDIENIIQIISGYVGAEAGLRFKIWYQHYRKFEPFVESVIDSGKMNFDFKSLLPTEKIVFVISACYYAKQKTILESLKTKNKFVALHNLCSFFKTYNVDSESQIMGLHNSFDFNMITKYKIYNCVEFFELFKNISEKITFNQK